MDIHSFINSRDVTAHYTRRSRVWNISNEAYNKIKDNGKQNNILILFFAQNTVMSGVNIANDFNMAVSDTKGLNWG